eukprot:s3990_g2.t1
MAKSKYQRRQQHEKIASWNFQRAVSAHFDCPIRNFSPKQFRECFAFLKRPTELPYCAETLTEWILEDVKFLVELQQSAIPNGEKASAQSRRPKAEEDARSKVLRAKAVAELVKHRKELAWAIEGNFNTYVRKMSRLGEWGGEPELLMLSKVLQRPIEVYMLTPNLKKVQTYGQEFQTKTIRVLFHGYGHYSALVEVEESFSCCRVAEIRWIAILMRTSWE